MEKQISRSRIFRERMKTQASEHKEVQRKMSKVDKPYYSERKGNEENEREASR